MREARQLLQLNRVGADVLRRDVLGLLPEFAGHFDLVYEYTCLCTLSPHLRGAYAKQVSGILRPGGVLLALLYPMRDDLAGDRGPPYLIGDSDLACLDQRFDRLESFVPAESAPERVGAERFVAWRKPDA